MSRLGLVGTFLLGLALPATASAQLTAGWVELGPPLESGPVTAESETVLASTMEAGSMTEGSGVFALASSGPDPVATPQDPPAPSLPLPDVPGELPPLPQPDKDDLPKLIDPCAIITVPNPIEQFLMEPCRVFDTEPNGLNNGTKPDGLPTLEDSDDPDEEPTGPNDEEGGSTGAFSESFQVDEQVKLPAVKLHPLAKVVVGPEAGVPVRPGGDAAAPEQPSSSSGMPEVPVPPAAALPVPDRTLPLPAALATGLAATGATSLLAPRMRRILTRALGAFLPAGFFSRVADDKVLEHPRRHAIHELVRQSPGIRSEAARRALGLAKGAFEHHLRLLATRRRLRLHRRDRELFLFPAGPAAASPPPGLRQRILEILGNAPGRCQRDLVNALGTTKRVVNYHVRALQSAGFLVVQRDGREARCYVAGGAPPAPPA